MLLERQIKTFVKNNYIPMVLKQIPANFDGSIGQLSICLKLDLTKTLRQNNQIGIFIIGNYARFTELVQESILEVMQDNNISRPEYGTNISYTINNCPLPRHNLESVQFLSAAFQQQNGVMIFLKDVHILQIGQPELYLFSWVQVWSAFCNCVGQKQLLKKKQTLLNIVKNKSQNLKEVVIKQVPRCSHCGSKLKNVGIQNKIFNNCQKMKVSVNMKGDNVKEEMFQRGELEIFIDESNTSKLKEGDIIDLCGYYSVEPRIVKIVADQINLKVQSGLFLVCYFASSTFTNNNNLFFSRLANLSCEYIKCDDPRDQETICYNYKNLLRAVNSIKFPYLNENNLSTLKLVIINCLFNQLHQFPIHILIITDEVSLLEKAVRLGGVVIKKWPTLYDNHSLLIFLSSCHNCILMVTNPTKKDFQYINSILHQKILSKVNFTLWIITEPSRDLRNEQAIQKISVVMDLSLEKNEYICKSVYDQMIDEKLESFIDESDNIQVTVPKGNERIKADPFQRIQEVFEGIECSEEERIKQQELAHRILQKYFLRAREYKHINTNSLQNIKALAEGFGYFRNFIREKGKINTKKPSVNILDAILAIFIEEETSRNKYSSSNTLFSNQISKLMLNEGDCELSFWDYQVDQNSQIGEAKRYLKKEDMFKRVVGKLMTLLYSHQIS